MKHHRLRSSKLSENSIKRSANDPPIKTISLFLGSLDSHIHQSFTKLRKERERGPAHQGHTLSQYQSHYREESSLKEHSTVDGVSKMMYNSERKEQEDSRMLHSRQQEPTTVYLDNEEVSQYVRLVYEMYNIPDPLQGTQPQAPQPTQSSQRLQKISIQASRRSFTGTPLLRKKSSASSFKEKMIQQRDIELGPFHSSRKPNQDRDREPQVDISLLSTIQKARPANQSRQKVVKLRHADAIPMTTPKVTASLSRTPSSLSGRFTPQTFRYCFACEATVLEANLKHHESQCRQLQAALAKSMEEVLAMLDDKIARLSREIRHNFIEGDSQVFIREYMRLKQSVGQWLTSVQQIDKENYQENAARRKMAQMSQGCGHSIGEHCEAIGKLHWFSRMRENMRRAYGV